MKRLAMIKNAVGTVHAASNLKQIDFAVGDRCVVGDKRWAGVVRFVGTTHFAEGTWIGVELDLKLGKNDGSVQGTRYFFCEPRRGIFVRANLVMTAASGSQEPDGSPEPITVMSGDDETDEAEPFLKGVNAPGGIEQSRLQGRRTRAPTVQVQRQRTMERSVSALTSRTRNTCVSSSMRSLCVEEEPSRNAGRKPVSAEPSLPNSAGPSESIVAGAANASVVRSTRSARRTYGPGRSLVSRTNNRGKKAAFVNLGSEEYIQPTSLPTSGYSTPTAGLAVSWGLEEPALDEAIVRAVEELRERVENLEWRFRSLLGSDLLPIEEGESSPSMRRSDTEELERLLRMRLLTFVEPSLLESLETQLAERLPVLVAEMTKEEVRKITTSMTSSSRAGTQRSSVFYGGHVSINSVERTSGRFPSHDDVVDHSEQAQHEHNAASLIQSAYRRSLVKSSQASRPLSNSMSEVRMFFDHMSESPPMGKVDEAIPNFNVSNTAPAKNNTWSSADSTDVAKLRQTDSKKKRVVVNPKAEDAWEEHKPAPAVTLKNTLGAALKPSLSEGLSTACTLQIIQVTDVYTLENFPNLRTLILDKRAQLEKRRGSSGSKTISCLTGDFLMPYLLSSIDGGRGMMTMINETPIDYLTWGNHEADLSHADVLVREQEYKGVWINSNMTDHESFEHSACQTRKAIVEIHSADGSNRRTIGMIGVLSDESNLYKAGAFGGALIDDPWEVMRTLKDELEGEDGVDLVLPMCHLYEYQDERTAEQFDFPVIIGGHDHHKVDRMINGTRVLKPGSDGHLATILTLTWKDASTQEPEIHAEFVEVKNWEPDPRLRQLSHDCYSVLDRLRQTELTVVPEKFTPFSSVGTRAGRSTTATFLCTSIRDALNLDCMKGTQDADCVLINGGNIRGNRDYPQTVDRRCAITLETLRSELDQDVHIIVVTVPGRVIQDALRDTWQAPSGAWMHYDDQVRVDAEGLVSHILDKPLKLNQEYRIGTTSRFGVRLAPKIAAYLDADPKGWPDPDSGEPVHTLLMHLYAELAWARVWHFLDPRDEGQICPEKIGIVDKNADGYLNKEELMEALISVGLNAHKGEHALVDILLSLAGDHEGDGQVSVAQITARRQERLHQLKPLKDNKALRSTRLDFLLSERKTLNCVKRPSMRRQLARANGPLADA